jgi:Flp pilus assembly protein TadB
MFKIILKNIAIVVGIIAVSILSAVLARFCLTLGLYGAIAYVSFVLVGGVVAFTWLDLQHQKRMKKINDEFNRTRFL